LRKVLRHVLSPLPFDPLGNLVIEGIFTLLAAEMQAQFPKKSLGDTEVNLALENVYPINLNLQLIADLDDSL
jgi:hypothetical protein